MIIIILYCNQKQKVGQWIIVLAQALVISPHIFLVFTPPKIHMPWEVNMEDYPNRERPCLGPSPS